MRGYVTRKELAEAIGVNEHTIWEWVRDGKLSAERAGNVLLFDQEAMQQALALKESSVRERRTYRPISGEEADLLTVAEVAQYLGKSERTVWRWVDSRLLPLYRRGRLQIFLHRRDVERIKTNLARNAPALEGCGQAA